MLLGTSNTNMVKLQRLQNSVVWVVTDTRKFDSITPVLRLHWLPIQSRIKYKIALLTCKALHTGQPEYLASLMQWHEPTRVLRSSAHQRLAVPEGVRTEFASCAFSCAAPEILNSLPPDVIDAFMSNTVAFSTLIWRRIYIDNRFPNNDRVTVFLHTIRTLHLDTLARNKLFTYLLIEYQTCI